MLTAFMTLAFLYLVVGDLIIFHQKALFHNDVFSGQPFSKPNKPDHLYKVKDKKDRVHVNLLTFVSDVLEIQGNPFHQSNIIFLSPTISLNIQDIISSSITYRGPPSFMLD